MTLGGRQRVVWRLRGDGHELRVATGEFRQHLLIGVQLGVAVRAPVAAIEGKYDRSALQEVLEAHRLPPVIGQHERRRDAAGAQGGRIAVAAEALGKAVKGRQCVGGKHRGELGVLVEQLAGKARGRGRDL